MMGRRYVARRLLQTYQVMANPREGGGESALPDQAPTSSAAEKLNDDPTPPFDSSMGLTILVLLTALFFMGFFSIYIRRFGNESPVEISRRRRLRSGYSAAASPSAGTRFCTRKGLDFESIKSLPVLSYTSGFGKHPIVVDCPVCLAEFEEGEDVKMLPSCQHLFHPECIDTWLMSRASCPLCRASKLFASARQDNRAAAGATAAEDGRGSDGEAVDMEEGAMRRCCSWSETAVVVWSTETGRGGLHRTRSF